MKYYISNDIKFIQGYGNLVSAPTQATHLKHKDASQYLITHPDHMVIQLGKTFKNNRNYVISTPQKFVNPHGKIVQSMRNALSFPTVEKAYEYIDTIGVNGIEEPFVIDENYKRHKRPHELKLQQAILEDMPGRRIVLSRQTRKIVADKSEICAICGKPLSAEDTTVDHWIPLSKGGSNNLNNLVPVHLACNRLKGDLTEQELDSAVTDIACNHIYHSPTSDMAVRMIRSMVRGTIERYRGAIA